MLDVRQAREGIAVYGLEGILAEHDDGDLGAAGEGLALDVGDPVVGQDDRADVLEGGERELVDVGQRRVLDREDLELVEAAKGEGLDGGYVVAVEAELLEGAQTGEGLAADHREVVLREGQLLEVGRQVTRYGFQAACVAEYLGIRVGVGFEFSMEGWILLENGGQVMVAKINDLLGASLYLLMMCTETFRVCSAAVYSTVRQSTCTTMAIKWENNERSNIFQSID